MVKVIGRKTNILIFLVFFLFTFQLSSASEKVNFIFNLYELNYYKTIDLDMEFSDKYKDTSAIMRLLWAEKRKYEETISYGLGFKYRRYINKGFFLEAGYLYMIWPSSMGLETGAGLRLNSKKFIFDFGISSEFYFLSTSKIKGELRNYKGLDLYLILSLGYSF